jgi:tetratricopeptide (TPR) repeat protein
MKSQQSLWLEGRNLLSEKKNMKKAENLLLKALKAKDDHPIYRHLTYNALIDLYYGLRDKRKDAIKNCEFYCKEDIKHLQNPEVLKTFKEEWDGLPYCPSFTRLAIIYEKNGEYGKAIETCEIAVKLGFEEDTKSGYSGRIMKLKKKKGE